MNISKTVNHRFALIVKDRRGWLGQSRKNAELAILSCFAKRDPDNCEFILLKRKPKEHK